MVGAICLLFGLLVMEGDSLLVRGVTYGTDFPAVANLPDQPYGVNVELDKIVNPTDLQQSLTLIKQAGFGYVRQVFAWNEIEISAKGDFYDHKNGKGAWDKYDRIVDQANAAGLQIIARLERPPDWSRANNQCKDSDGVPQSCATKPPDKQQDYGDFVAAFVQHYAGRVHYVQIWNEPNRFEDWGYQPVDPAAYTRLLAAGYQAAKKADPSITVLSAALTPTTDCCTKNRPDPVYLQQMYDAGARGNFDILGAQAYGLRAGPENPLSDFPWHPLAAKRAIIASQNTNFGRVSLDRDVMVHNGDAAKPVWVGEFGWNALPPNWQGDASPWGTVTPEQQATYTVQAYQRARTEWPWLGTMALWLFQDPSPSDRDPTQFFALVDASYHPRPIFDALTKLIHSQPIAYTGTHKSMDPASSYSGAWQPTANGRISPVSGAEINLSFYGQAAAVQIARGPNAGIAYVKVDGSPTYATEMAKDSAGRAALDEYAPQTSYATAQVASGLPLGSHVLTVTVSGLQNSRSSGAGVEVDGFSVGLTRDQRPVFFGGGLAALGALVLGWKVLAAWSRRFRPKLGPIAGEPASIGSAIARPTVPSWKLAQATVEKYPLAPLGAGLAIFYFAPPLPVAVVGAVLFLAAAMVRLDAALVFVPLVAPFYLQPKHIRGAELPLSEVVISLCLAALLLRSAWSREWRWPSTRFWWPAALFFVAASASVLAADFPRYALREYRTDIIEPLVFFGLILMARPRPKLMLDALLIGGVITALVGLAQYVGGHGIQAEGVRRMVSVYQSPDNLGLYLGRLVPIAASLCLLSPGTWRQRLPYALATVLMLAAVALSFTRGAWLGVFFALLLVAGFAGRRWLGAALAGGVVSGAGVSLVQAKRIQSIFQFTPGSTGFSRLALWRATADMIRAHPIFGVGLDNFLYQYPRYILSAGSNEPDLSHPHNVILDFWSRIGIVGLSSFVWLEGVFFLKIAKLIRGGQAWTRCLAVALLASMTDTLIHGMVDNSYFLIDLSLVFWLTLGLSQVLEWRNPRAEDSAT